MVVCLPYNSLVDPNSSTCVCQNECHKYSLPGIGILCVSITSHRNMAKKMLINERTWHRYCRRYSQGKYYVTVTTVPQSSSSDLLISLNPLINVSVSYSLYVRNERKRQWILLFQTSRAISRRADWLDLFRFWDYHRFFPVNKGTRASWRSRSSGQPVLTRLHCAT